MLRLGKELLIFDGGMGSELERMGLGDADPMECNLTHPDAVRAIHRAYAQAGADILTTNTFGLNRVKYRGQAPMEEVALAAVSHAREAGKTVFFDVGPTGALLAPIGTLTFDEAYAAFAEIAELTSDRVDGYIVETFSDLYELKACILALKEHTDKPIFATMTFDRTGRTLTGSTPEIAALCLEGLGVDALGVNCSLGPQELWPVVGRMLAATSLPVIVQPNRGLPVWREGRTVYELSEDDFAAILLNFEFLGFSGGDQTEFTGFHLQPGIVELEGHGAFEHQFEGGHGLVELEKFVAARKDGGVDDIFGPQGDGVVSAVVPRFGVHVERDPFPEDFRLRLKIHSMNASL